MHRSTPPEERETDLASRCRAAAERAAAAGPHLAAMTGAERAALLRSIAAGLRDRRDEILAANADDVRDGAGLAPALRDRLLLDDDRVLAMARAVEQIADQPDPLGRVVDGRTLANGMRLTKRRVPLGTVLVVYESRPNVTSDAAALCIKAGNSVVLKGGREADASNRAIVSVVRDALRNAGGDELADAVTLVQSTDRAAVAHLVRLSGVIDLAIPRGGSGLIRAVCDAATVPVVKHDAGVCHLYIDEHLTGMLDDAVRIAVNAKAQRPGVCNAIETLLVHAVQADRVLPAAAEALGARGVELRGDARARAIVPTMREASNDDWAAEYLDLILAVRVVESLDDAVAHIRAFGSKHTDAIVTSSTRSARRFTTMVDSASVMVNCSTRFADGGMYGLGAEIGISTDKLHARGPMGAEDLTTTQWLAEGDGHIREA